MVQTFDGNSQRPSGRMAENWNRRDNIRAGAVSGPWRSAPRDSDAEAAPVARPVPEISALEADLRAPTLRPVEPVLALTEPVEPPLVQRTPRVPAPEPIEIADGTQIEASLPQIRGRSKAHQYSVLGAVLLGSLIAGAIIALAFLLRPADDAPSQAVTPRAGAIVASN